MLAGRAAPVAFTLVTATRTMTSQTAMTSTEARGIRAPPSTDGGSGSPGHRLQKLLSVPGYDPSRVNDLLLLRPDPERTSNKHVVFFHGDIQNFQEEMSQQPDGSQWISWSLEQVAFILGRRFPDRHVWVVRASRMYLHKFTCYHNFVKSNMFGAPEHTPDHGAFLHLRALLGHAMQRADLPNVLRPQGGANSIPSEFSLTLVGFSKGCVVLNQMLYELSGASADPQLSDFVKHITEMFWLDGGHPGGSHTWVTDKKVLKVLAFSGVSIHAHVTPYEVRDPMRSWVGREHQTFIKTLEEFGARPSKKLHFEDEPPSIQNHFRVLQEF